MTLEGFLASVGEQTPAPGGGAAAAVGCALGASLAEMAARFAGRDDAVERAAALRERGLALAEEDLTAYAPVLAALRLPPDDPARPEALRAAASAAADVPLAIAEAAASVAVLARELAEYGRPGLRGDALAGADLAGGAARAAARLVEMAARFAARDDAVERAAALRARGLALAEDDLTAYVPVLAALRLPADDPARPEALRAASSAAADVPLAIAETAASVVVLAREMAESGRPGLRGDALAGADLAAGSARAAARLVEINLTEAPDDPRLARARAAVRRVA